MDDDIITIYQKKLDFLKKINDDQEYIKKELEKQNKIINSQYEILNIIMSNKFIKANGLLRNLQLHVLEMLKFVTGICNKYNLEYWLEFGTLLGAVRHEGFIPWDDEIDIAMSRKDFERFLKVLPTEIDRFEGLREKLTIRNGGASFKNAKYSDNCPSAVLQFINRSPYAGLEVHPIEFVALDEENPNLEQYSKDFVKYRKKFKEDYINNKCSFEEGFIECSKKMGVTNEKTEFLASSPDGANRKLFYTKNVFPLKKTKFEDYEVTIPNNPIEHLATYYKGDIMNIPKDIHHHSFTDLIKRRENGKDLDKLYEETLSFWRNINNNF